MTCERILVMAHAHPDFQKGGGELAAYYLCQKHRQEGHYAVFLGCVSGTGQPRGVISMRAEHDYTWEQAADAHTMRTVNTSALFTHLSDFVNAVQPTRIHLHHYHGVGLETLFALKRLAPKAQIWLTLHEYLAICPHYGQMIKRNTHELCYKSSPEECQQCVQTCSVENIWLRKKYTQLAFALVDRFISPSEFLKNRYVEWGLSAERIDVEENWLPPMEKLPPRELHQGEGQKRFGFFGQITPFKGLDVLLEALHQLPPKIRKCVVLEVNGSGLERQDSKFQHTIEQLRKPLIREGVVQWRGPYQPHQMRERMASVDYVVVPSIWWENSPLVIQEAKGYGRPLLVSNIGGMAEKVRDGVDGRHVPVGDRAAWGKVVTSCKTISC